MSNKNYKKVFKFFTIFEYEKEQEYLRSMHRSGWKFLKVSGFCVYHFTKCEPADVTYQLDYHRNGEGHKDDYIQMFSDCGWEYLQDYMEYSYFRKSAIEGEENDEIFCDDESRYGMLERVFKGRMLPCSIFFLCVFVPNFILTLNHAPMLCILHGLIILLYGVVFFQYLRKLKQFRSRIK